MVKDENETLDIVILSYERSKTIEEMLLKLRERTHYPHRVIVCDNKSRLLVRENLKKLRRESFIDELIFNDFNKWPEGFNTGLKIVCGDFYCLSDPDIIVPDLGENCWLTKLVNYMNKYSFIGKLGLHISMSNYPLKPVVSREYCIRKFESKYIENTNEEIYDAPVDTTMAIYRRDLFKTYNGNYPEIPCDDHQSMYDDKYCCGRTAPPLSCIHRGNDEYIDGSEENIRYLVSKNKIFKSKHYRSILRTLKFKNFKDKLKKSLKKMTRK